MLPDLELKYDPHDNHQPVGQQICYKGMICQFPSTPSPFLLLTGRRHILWWVCLVPPLLLNLLVAMSSLLKQTNKLNIIQHKYKSRLRLWHIKYVKKLKEMAIKWFIVSFFKVNMFVSPSSGSFSWNMVFFECDCL